MRNLRLISFLSLLAIATLASTSAFADTVYTYTGAPYSGAIGAPYTTSDFLTMSFTFAEPPVGFTVGPVPLFYSFSNGVETLDSSTSTLFPTSILVIQNGSTDITGWNISITSKSDPNIFLVSSSAFGDEVGGDTGFALNQTPGTWTTATVVAPAVTPEPSSLILLGTGALGLLGAARHRFHRV
jgi:hypothetical protein